MTELKQKQVQRNTKTIGQGDVVGYGSYIKLRLRERKPRRSRAVASDKRRRSPTSARRYAGAMGLKAVEKRVCTQTSHGACFR